MPDHVDRLIHSIGITGSDAKTLQFVVGAGITAYFCYTYSINQGMLPFFGILIGAYLVLKSIK